MKRTPKSKDKKTIFLKPSVGQAEPYIWYWYDIPNTHYHVSGYGDTKEEAKVRFEKSKDFLEKFLAKKKMENYLEDIVFDFGSL